MAKVSKAVREKRKDFAKTKLKVGKSKQLPTNHTETSFKSKAVVLPKQSVTQDIAVKESKTLQHYIALLSHKSADTRKETLQQLTAYLLSNPPRLSTTITPLVKVLALLIIDDAPVVRKMLLELYNTVLARLQAQSLNSNTELFLLYISSAMTHISPSIRADSTKFFDWALRCTNATELIVSAQFEKFLNTFATLFNWVGQTNPISSTKVLSSHLAAFRDILNAALVEQVPPSSVVDKYDVPLKLNEEYFISHRTTPNFLASCQSLNLFDGQDSIVDADSTAFDLVKPHMSNMMNYMTDRFTDSSNGDRSFCLPILQIFETVISCNEARDRQDVKSALTKLSRSMQLIEESAGQGLTQGLIGQWRIVQEAMT